MSRPQSHQELRKAPSCTADVHVPESPQTNLARQHTLWLMRTTPNARSGWQETNSSTLATKIQPRVRAASTLAPAWPRGLATGRPEAQRAGDAVAAARRRIPACVGARGYGLGVVQGGGGPRSTHVAMPGPWAFVRPTAGSGCEQPRKKTKGEASGPLPSL